MAWTFQILSQHCCHSFILGRHIGEERQRQAQEGTQVIGSNIFPADLNIESETEIVAKSLGVIAGKFYERVGVSLKPPLADRNEVKGLFFESLYGNLKTMRNSKIFKKLEEVSPPFAAAILDIKKDNYQELSHQLQRIESQIVIEGCCRKLMNISPSMPLLTVHDELMTTKQYELKVAIELQYAFFKTCGYLCVVSN